MMEKLTRRGEDIARAAQKRAVGDVAERLRNVLQGITITTEEMLVIASGRGLLKRWLFDPQLRFLSGDLR